MAGGVAPRLADADGVATLVLPMLLWVAGLVAVVGIDLGAFLVAAARAQQLADAAALAAVSVDATLGPRGNPTAEATRVAAAGGGELDDCRCSRRDGTAAVTVSVPVPGLVLPSLGARRVAADAQAVLVPGGRTPPIERPRTRSRIAPGTVRGHHEASSELRLDDKGRRDLKVAGGRA